MEPWLMWALIGWLALGTLATVTMVGKPRKPMTGGQAAFAVFVNLAIISALIIWGNAS